MNSTVLAFSEPRSITFGGENRPTEFNNQLGVCGRDREVRSHVDCCRAWLFLANVASAS